MTPTHQSLLRPTRPISGGIHRGLAVGPVLIAVLLATVLLACSGAEPSAGGGTSRDVSSEGAAWMVLFNGTDLTGWTPKITGSDLGDDPFGTFSVEDGLLTVGYDEYDDFGGRFGHLFYETPFSDYELRIEYRFVGEQIEGGPGWALRNSGVMFHAQDPATMLRDQDFPISLEAQFLGGNDVDERSTASLCTPGTNVEMNGELIEEHCIQATAPTFHGDQWVTFDLIVHGSGPIHHVIAGDTVISYSHPTIGGGVVDGFDPSAKEDGRPLSGGWIALQSESHPVQFRQVLIRPLAPGN